VVSPTASTVEAGAALMSGNESTVRQDGVRGMFYGDSSQLIEKVGQRGHGHRCSALMALIFFKGAIS